MVPPRDKKKSRTRNPPKMTKELALEGLRTRNLHREKHFPKDSNHPFYKRCALKKYLPLIRKRFSHNETIVREFYVQTRATEDLSICFRGKGLYFDATTIRKYLQCPVVSHCSYDAFKSSPHSIPWDTILETLAVPGASWRIQGCKSYLDRKVMTEEARIWLNFMCCNVKPRAHMATISKDDDALLLYCLMHPTHQVDISEIACEAILACAKSDTMNLIFPHLISEMCTREGVLAQPEDLHFSVVKATNYSSYATIQAASRKRSKHVSDDGEAEQDDMVAISDSKLDQLLEIMNEEKARCLEFEQNLFQRLDKIEHQLRCIEGPGQSSGAQRDEDTDTFT